MNRWLVLAQSSAVILLAGMFGTAVQAAPPQLLNKTIHVEMSVSVPARWPDGTERVQSRRIDRNIYVSSQGRLFQKVSRQAKGGADQKEFGPDSGGGVHFAGNKLVGVVKVISGANMLTISFDPSFQSCTADMIVGSESGKARVWKGLNGVTFTATGKPQVSGVSCSIREGNAFAS
jgi:hypothetical protein